MFVLGHIGIGRRMAARAYRTFSRGDRRAFLVGVLLPDLIDKPLYYLASWLTGKKGAQLGLISGTHSFGHTGLFLVAVGVAALVARARPLRALAIGAGTHIVLDVVGLTLDAGTVLWPLFGWGFAPHPFGNLTEHLWTVLRPVTLAGEVIGAGILWWDHRKNVSERSGDLR